MSDYCSKTAVITKGNENSLYYKIDIDSGSWFWYDWMFDESFSDKGENQTAYDYEQLKEIAIELIRADVSPSAVAFLAKEIYKELKKK